MAISARLQEADFSVFSVPKRLRNPSEYAFWVLSGFPAKTFNHARGPEFRGRVFFCVQSLERSTAGRPQAM